MAETRIRRDRYAEVGGELPVVVRIESGEQVRDRTGTCKNIPEGRFLVTLDQPAWKVAGKLAARAGLIAERAFTARPNENLPSYEAELSRPNLPEPDLNQLWITDYEDGMHDDYTTDIETLNHRIKTSPRPKLLVNHVPDRPGLLVARRSVAIGHLLHKSLRELKRFEHIGVIPSGHHREAEARDKSLAKGVLLQANVDVFNYSIVEAEADLRALAELETYPVNNSLREAQ